ncbi:hypothetical protein N9R59_02890 [Porticoccaceae bacterium]|nr:hypothetical protein [Porticoccaceae bacterium]
MFNDLRKDQWSFRAAQGLLLVAQGLLLVAQGLLFVAQGCIVKYPIGRYNPRLFRNYSNK